MRLSLFNPGAAPRRAGFTRRAASSGRRSVVSFLVLGLLAALSLVVLPAGTAHAATLGGFEIDGNTVVDAEDAMDWADVPNTCVDDGFSDDTGYAGKEDGDPLGWTKQGVDAKKTDIGWVEAYSAEDPDTQDLWTYLGFQRKGNTGTTRYTLEYNPLANVMSTDGTVPVPNRSDGDFKIAFSQTGNGPIVITEYSVYDGTKWVAATPPAGAISGVANDGAVTFCGSDNEGKTFIEIAINLSALGLADQGCDSPGYGTLNLRSRQSDASNANLSDYVATTIDLPRNCATATIVKKDAAGEVIDTGAGTLTFTVSPDPATGTSGSSATIVDNSDADLDDRAGYVSFETEHFGTYTVTETVPPAGYFLPWPTDARSTTVTLAKGEEATATFTDPKGSLSWTKVDGFTAAKLCGATFTVDVTVGEDTTTITVVDNGANDADEDCGEFLLTGLAPGTWTLTETVAPTGYAAPDGTPAWERLVAPSDNPAQSVRTAVPNWENGKISWIKHDDAGEVLGGAWFEVCEDMVEGECVLVEDNTGDAGYEGYDMDPRAGYFLLTGLDFGDYTVAEAQAPDGYLMDGAVMKVTVTASAEPIAVGVFVNVKKVYGLTLTKAAYEGESLTDETVDFGDTVTYALTVTATGNAPSTMVTVTDTLPVGVTYVANSATCIDAVSPCVASYDAATRTLTWVIDEMVDGTSVKLVFDVTVDAAPEVAPGTTYTWTGDNMGAAMSDQTPKVPSNVVTIKASKTVLPETGGNTLPLILGGILAIIAGGVLVLAGRRRENTR